MLFSEVRHIMAKSKYCLTQILLTLIAQEVSNLTANLQVPGSSPTGAFIFVDSHKVFINFKFFKKVRKQELLFSKYGLVSHSGRREGFIGMDYLRTQDWREHQTIDPPYKRQ